MTMIKPKALPVVLLGAALLAMPLAGGATQEKKEATAAAAGVVLKGADGKDLSLADFKDKKALVVVFVGTECPLVGLYMPKLAALHSEYASKGVGFLAVNSNSQDTLEQAAAHAKKHLLPFPVAKDPEQRLADLLQIERTPTACVLDRQGRVLYRGRIDDQFGVGYQRPEATRQELVAALNEVLEGKPVSQPRTEAVGCFIGREKRTPAAAATVTYTRHVSRILQKHCLECHRPQQIGPVALVTYDQVRSWADTIREVVSEKRMPPWHPDPRYGKFSNDRSLPAAEREQLLAWIDQGCPKGDDKDMPPPASYRGQEGWVIGKPDVVLSMQEDFVVPAKAPPGGVPYQTFVIPTKFTEDKWIQAAECRPGNRAVVHHILVYVRVPGEQMQGRHEDIIGRNFLVGTAPGDMPTILAPGLAKKIPKGSYLIFQMHYTPNGVEQPDRSSVGLIFAKEPPRQIVRTRTILNRWFKIPPGDNNHQVISESVFNRDAVILSFMPHMHLRGKSFQYEAVYPDGRKEILLSVPRYDFNWQSTYRLAEPLRIPAGTKILCTAHFDNSEENLSNPDPRKVVSWGDQTWDEMMIGWVDYYYVDEKPSS